MRFHRFSSRFLAHSFCSVAPCNLHDRNEFRLRKPLDCTLCCTSITSRICIHVQCVVVRVIENWMEFKCKYVSLLI